MTAASPKGTRGVLTGPRETGGWVRLLLLDSLQNPVGRQRGGLLHALLRGPVDAAFAEQLVRYLRERPFATSGTLGGWVAGPLRRRLEARRASTEETEGETILERSMLHVGPAVAGLGGRLIQGALVPAFGLLSVFAALYWSEIWVLCYAVAYCGFQLYWRRRSWTVGLAGEASVVLDLRSGDAERWARSLGVLARLAGGTLLGALLVTSGNDAGITGPAAVVSLCVAGWVLARRGRFGPVPLGWAAIVAALALSRWFAR